MLPLLMVAWLFENGCFVQEAPCHTSDDFLWPVGDLSVLSPKFIIISVWSSLKKQEQSGSLRLTENTGT